MRVVLTCPRVFALDVGGLFFLSKECSRNRWRDPPTTDEQPWRQADHSLSMNSMDHDHPFRRRRGPDAHSSKEDRLVVSLRSNRHAARGIAGGQETRGLLSLWQQGDGALTHDGTVLLTHGCLEINLSHRMNSGSSCGKGIHDSDRWLHKVTLTSRESGSNQRGNLVGSEVGERFRLISRLHIHICN